MHHFDAESGDIPPFLKKPCNALILVRTGHAFLAFKCICLFYLQYILNIFQNDKVFQTKMWCVHIHILPVFSKSFQENPNFCGVRVKVKLGAKIRL
jgi:hypothetical protein